jgi:hypothetical protein
MMKRLMTAAVLLSTVSVCGCSQTSASEPPAAERAAAPADRPVASPDAVTPTAAGPVATPAPGPDYREITVPAGTLLPVELTTSVASDSSNVEDAIRATLRQPIVVRGTELLPAGSVVSGHVTAAERSARVKGRGRVAFRFTTIDPPGRAERLSIRTATISRLAPATKKQDAAKIGGGAAGGAIIGGILGGGDGAAKGAAIGGAAGTGVVLSTRGKDVRLGRGARVTVRLTEPLTVRVPSRS